MTIDIAIEQTLAQMPEDLKKEVLHYALYLMSNCAEKETSKSKTAAKRRSGILKDMFVLPLSEDFDEPLEDMQDYMS
ncbi:DUF2281 domain-containing protein [Oscillatoria sp. CS-180]|uniref:type II toxin-antitoxin system VapB family antitoxin n=1 Tax=Oscillatoria sp. CS-180 TaxID=3021720 RepID=UPI00233016DB|nr:DUF2281 domain-containing protein [Oscillatoria sp. CS-180]MDB9525601.1 DUF2281 domain-containing protein [Oscillatoria sp. CS-180]